MKCKCMKSCPSPAPNLLSNFNWPYRYPTWKFPSEVQTYQAKVSKRKFPGEISKVKASEGSWVEAIKRKFPSEKSKVGVTKRTIPSECSPAKVPKRKFPSEKSHGEVSRRSLLATVPMRNTQAKNPGRKIRREIYRAENPRLTSPGMDFHAEASKRLCSSESC